MSGGLNGEKEGARQRRGRGGGGGGGGFQTERSRCKGPEAGMSLVGQKKSQKVRVAERPTCAGGQLRTQAPDGK